MTLIALKLFCQLLIERLATVVANEPALILGRGL